MVQTRRDEEGTGCLACTVNYSISALAPLAHDAVVITAAMCYSHLELTAAAISKSFA